MSTSFMNGQTEGDMTSEWTSRCGHVQLLNNHLATLGAFSAFSFLTSSPCWVTWVNKQVSVDVVGGAGVEVGGAMPGL